MYLLTRLLHWNLSVLVVQRDLQSHLTSLMSPMSVLQTWMQEFAEGGGVKRASTTMNLLVADRSHLQMIMDAAIAVTNLSLEIKLANLGSVTGSFLIENFELTGEYNDAATVSFTARSNGEFSFIKNTI